MKNIAFYFCLNRKIYTSYNERFIMDKKSGLKIVGGLTIVIVSTIVSALGGKALGEGISEIIIGKSKEEA